MTDLELFRVDDTDRGPRLRINHPGLFLAAIEIYGPLFVAIEKWRKMVALHDEGTFVTGGGSKTCALCHVYLEGKDESCQGCPVARFTGDSFCGNTPHDSYVVAVDNGDEDEARELAQRMLALLENLEKDYSWPIATSEESE